MILIVGTILAFALLEWPWRLLVMVPLAAVEILEVALWLRLRRMRALSGADALIGVKGKALSDCDPTGQVKARGTIWKAHCPEGAEAGDEVEIVGMNGLLLEVRPVEPSLTRP